MVADLLRHGRDGYPTEYLVARVRGRRAALARAQRSQAIGAATSDEEIWSDLTREFDWLHRQMSAHLRDTLAPLFGLFELKTMVLAIRNTAIDRRLTVRRVLQHSLLADHARRALHDAPDGAAAVAALVAALTAVTPAFGTLATTYADAQLRGFEDALVRVYLQEVAAARLHPAVRAFVASFIDARNIVLLYKALRWDVGRTDQFIAGGTLDVSVFTEARARQDAAAVDALSARVARRTPRSLAPSEPALETALLNGLTALLNSRRRDVDDVDVMVAYIWRVYVNARNRSLLHHARDVDEGVLGREVLQ